ncbi:MAG: hypothetical protein U5K72_17705 [Balneolaceae bacterium]|nr:hypothetical protein [Balneolaceae bacterium]
MAKPNFEEEEEISPFDYYLKDYDGVPSLILCSVAYTKNLKLKPFEEYISETTRPHRM